MVEKKVRPLTVVEKRLWVEVEHPQLSIRQQCESLGLHRSSFYLEPAGETAKNLLLMRLLDEEYVRHPEKGSRKMREWLKTQKHVVNRKRMQRLMRLMGIASICPQPGTSRRHPSHKIYPYLLRNVEIVRPNQVWSTDITYVPMPHGSLYLTAVIDWYSRHVLAWELSNTLHVDFCMSVLETSLAQGTPEIFNTDQGSQYTSLEFTGRLTLAGVAISMDGRGRALDNVFVERLGRTVKYEEIYPRGHATAAALTDGLENYFHYYCHERQHQALGYRTPAEVYYEKRKRPHKV